MGLTLEPEVKVDLSTDLSDPASPGRVRPACSVVAAFAASAAASAAVADYLPVPAGWLLAPVGCLLAAKESPPATGRPRQPQTHMPWG